jgi:hypothetical protein
MRGAVKTRWAAGVAAGLCALTLAACDRQVATPDAETAPPSNAEREAELAAEQLAALGAAADDATRALYTGDFQASGNLDAGSGEGAWELRLLENYADFTRPGLGQDGGFAGERDYRAGGMRVVAGSLTITVRAEACPTPTGEPLPYTADVLFEGVNYHGCARRGVDDSARPTWASVLPELLPAIDACLARVTSRPARVTTASPMDEGVVLVRVRENDGGRRECVAAADGSSVANYDTLSDNDRMAGEGEIEFQRTGNQPAARNCQAVEEAKDHLEQRVGWLIRRTC